LKTAKLVLLFFHGYSNIATNETYIIHYYAET